MSFQGVIMNLQTCRMTQCDFVQESDLAHKLIQAYAVDFWGGTWKELLVVRDSNGNVVEQFGTMDAHGMIFPETRELLDRFGLASSDPQWPSQLWLMSQQGRLCTHDGDAICPFWTLASARAELITFVSPVEAGGYGGEILVLMQSGDIVGFTAYTSLLGDIGRQVAFQRFSSTCFQIPIGSPSCSQTTVQTLLEVMYPGDQQFGIFLDHAIAESSRNRGLGSRLFDARIERLLELGTDVFFGRTMLTVEAQYKGNYLARGLVPFAADGTDSFSHSKHYFTATRAQIRVRKRS